jgi:hypothetical protein
MARLLYRSNERGRVPLKLPASRCQRRARFVAHEEHATELVFQRMNSCADSRLAYMKPIRGADKVSTRNNRQKGSSELCVHRERLFVSDL